jgi:hypothetical protein
MHRTAAFAAGRRRVPYLPCRPGVVKAAVLHVVRRGAGCWPLRCRGRHMRRLIDQLPRRSGRRHGSAACGITS